MQAFSAHQAATVGLLVEPITDWPDDDMAISVRNILLNLLSALFGVMDHPGDISIWAGAVAHMIGLLHHNIYFIAKAASYFDLRSSSPGG